MLKTVLKAFLNSFRQLRICFFPNFRDRKIFRKLNGLEHVKEVGHVPLRRIRNVELSIDWRNVDNDDSIDDFWTRKSGVHDRSSAHRMSDKNGRLYFELIQ